MKQHIEIDVPAGYKAVFGKDAPDPLPDDAMDAEGNLWRDRGEPAQYTILCLPDWPQRPTQEQFGAEWEVDGDEPVKAELNDGRTYAHPADRYRVVKYTSSDGPSKLYGGFRWPLKPRKPKRRPWTPEEWADHVGCQILHKDGSIRLLLWAEQYKVWVSEHRAWDKAFVTHWRWPSETEWREVGEVE